MICEKLVFQFKEAGIELTEYQLKQFGIYYHEILNWNQRINLISKKDESRIIERHFLESSAFSLFQVFQGSQSVLDLGSGGGFPGVPLKIMHPQLSMTLLDSKRMKALFLKRLVEKLNLNDVEVLCERAEVAALKSPYHHGFDVVVSRAVAALPTLYKWAQPFLKAKGALMAVKGSNVSQEIRNLKHEFPNLTIEVKPILKERKGRSKGSAKNVVIIRQDENQTINE